MKEIICLASIRGEGKMKYKCQRKGVSLDNTKDVPRNKIVQHCFIYKLHKGLHRVHYVAGKHGLGVEAHKSMGTIVDVFFTKE